MGLTLSPLDHKNLQKTTSFNWKITDESWQSQIEEFHKTLNVPNSQLEFSSDIGVYDVYARLQTSESEQVTIFGQEVSYGPTYEKSLVHWKM